MADSSITKQALASSLKELMQEEHFSKISVGDICEHCGMNRKSFYYHFRDKYDLMNWIFRSEFSRHTLQSTYTGAWDAFEDLCAYLHGNRKFYCKALSVEGQNSFREFFKEECMCLFVHMLGQSYEPPDSARFYEEFFADAFVCAIDRWIREDDLPPDEFARLMRGCVTHKRADRS